MPLIDSLKTGAGRFFETTLRDFPLSILSSVLASVFFVLFLQHDTKQEVIYFANLGLVCALGISLFMTVEMIALLQKDFKYGSIAKLLVAVFLIGFYFYLPEVWYGHAAVTTMLLFICSFLLLSFLPVWNESEEVFWKYNITLFRNILFALLISFLFWLGISAALKALEFLFDVKISTKLYPQTAAVLFGGFLGIHFSNQFERAEIYGMSPSLVALLQRISSFLLLPLLFVYCLILIGYIIKTILIGELPKGWISKLVLMYSGLAILVYLLIYRLKDKSSLIKNNIFYTLLPAVVFLFVAIFRRIDDYGVTVPRYFVALMGVWILFVSLSQVFFKSKTSLRFIPASLFAFCLLALYGPQSAFSVTKRSQINRVLQLVNQWKSTPDEDINNQIVSALDLLENDFKKETLRELNNSLGLHLPDSMLQSEAFFDALDLKTNQLRSKEMPQKIYSVHHPDSPVLPELTDGLYFINRFESDSLYQLGDKEIQFRMADPDQAEVFYDGRVWKLDLTSFLSALEEKHPNRLLSSKDLIYRFDGIPGVSILIQFTHIDLTDVDHPALFWDFALVQLPKNE